MHNLGLFFGARLVRPRLFFVVHVLFGAIAFFAGDSVMAAEKYAREGDALYQSVAKHILDQRLCKTLEECKTKLNVYGEDGDKVNFHLYECNDRKMLAAVVGYIVADGLRVTGGVPISVRVFAEPKTAHTGFKGLISKEKEILKLEVNK